MIVEISAQVDGEFDVVGAITTLPGAGPTFSYAEQWLSRARPRPLSLSIPLGAAPLPDRAIRPYFEGMLPEEEARKAISRELGVSGGSYVRMLAALGDECVGAVSARSGGEEPAERRARYVALGQEEFSALAEDGYAAAGRLSAASRLSLAGAQAKVGLYRDPSDGTWHRPVGRAPSNCVVKPESQRFEGLVDNEVYCMRLAAACGLEAARVHRMAAGGPMIVVERYDRVLRPGSTCDGRPLYLRLHQEDFCQALGVLPSRKYEEGPSRHLAAMEGLLRRHATRAADDVLRLYDMVVFNALIGNCDAHLKNFSLMRGPDWSDLSLAPAYDLVSTSVYPGLTRTMAMGVGGQKKLDLLRREDLIQAARDMHIGRATAASRLDALCDAAVQNADRCADSDMADKIAGQVRKRAAVYGARTP